MVPAAFVIVVFFLLWTSAKSAASNVTGCISDYNEFKNLTLNQGVYGARNRLQLFEAFYGPNVRLPFSVFVFYETVLPNGTTENIITGKCAGLTAWAWISSPLFLVVRAEFLNTLSMYTLNHFNTLTTVTVTITVPRPCKTKQLLAMFTSELQEIALGESQCGAYISNIDHFCATGKVITQSLGNKLVPVALLAGTGFLFQILFISFISANLGLQVSTYISQKASDYSFDGYGMFWGISTSAFLCTIGLCIIDISLIVEAFKRNGAVWAFSYFMLFILIFIWVTSLLVVVYIFRKNRPQVTVPRMYTFAFQLLSCCCCREPWAETVVIGVAWWFILFAIQGVLCHGMYILLAALASPTTVPLNVMVIVLLFVCTTYTSALLYTIFAYICTSPRRWRLQKGGGTVVVRAAILVPLLVAMLCYTILMATCGSMVNSDTKQNYYPSLITSAIGTVIVGLVVFGLKWFITAWFKWSPSSTGLEEHINGHENGDKGYHIIRDARESMLD